MADFDPLVWNPSPDGSYLWPVTEVYRAGNATGSHLFQLVQYLNGQATAYSTPTVEFPTQGQLYTPGYHTSIINAIDALRSAKGKGQFNWGSQSLLNLNTVQNMRLALRDNVIATVNFACDNNIFFNFGAAHVDFYSNQGVLSFGNPDFSTKNQYGSCGLLQVFGLDNHVVAIGSVRPGSYTAIFTSLFDPISDTFPLNWYANATAIVDCFINGGFYPAGSTFESIPGAPNSDPGVKIPPGASDGMTITVSEA